MTLLDMANFVCGKVTQTEAEDLTACKGFLQRRFEMLWQDQLWKDSLVEYVQTLNPGGYTVTNNWLPTRGILLLPPIIDRVLAARTDARKLNIQRPELYYRIDFDAFAKKGSPADYLNLPKCVWEFDTAQPISAVVDAPDLNAVVTADTVDADGVGVTRQAMLMAAATEALGTTLRVDAVTKLATAKAVNLTAGGLAPTLTNASGVQDTFNIGPDNSANHATQTFLNVANGATVSYVQAGAAYVFSGNLGLNGTAIPAGTGAISFDGATFTFTPQTVFSTTFLTMQLADTSAPRRCRIRMVQIPDPATNYTPIAIRVLGKRTPPSFTADGDSPMLTGVENCLLAFAQGDMLQRERHYAKAQLLQTEGQMLLAQLKEVEVVQQAHNQQIIPEHGYGDEHFDRLQGFSF